jgi:hypothetical protein
MHIQNTGTDFLWDKYVESTFCDNIYNLKSVLITVSVKDWKRAFKDYQLRGISLLVWTKDNKPTGVAFVPYKTSTNTKLHELGHIDHYQAGYYKIGNADNFIFSELYAENFKNYYTNKDEIKMDVIYAISVEVINRYKISANHVGNTMQRALNKFSYSFNAYNKMKLIRTLNKLSPSDYIGSE